MRLAAEQVDRFYDVWKPLLLFVNRRLRLVPALLRADFSGPLGPSEIVPIRDALWADDGLRAAFVAENPAGLSAEDLALVESWRDRRAGKFYVLRHLKKHSIFIAVEGGSTVYAVVGLASPLGEIVPFVPCYVEAVLLPFEGQVIYDSLIAPWNVTFGKGIRDNLDHLYKDAKERGAIVTSLEPAGPVSREEGEEAARSTDARVLDAFRAYLFASGLSTRVVERDLANVGAFAERYRLDPVEPRSLRAVGARELGEYVARLGEPPFKEGQRRQAVTSLKRFIRFLRDSGRMDFDDATDAEDVLKRPG